jgi:hypothetical protein
MSDRTIPLWGLTNPVQCRVLSSGTWCGESQLILRINFRLSPQAQRMSQGRTQHEGNSELCFACCLFHAGLFLCILKIETIFSSEMSVKFQRTTRYCIPEYKILHGCCFENLKSYNIILHSVCRLSIIENIYALYSCNRVMR